MIREKIFRRHKQQKSPSGQKFVFSFSNIQAVQVPKGWDKLVLCLASSESGKRVHRSGKAPVKDGICQWTEALSESVWLSKELEECQLKFLVSTGASRSGILGEATLNLAPFLSSDLPVAVSLPLKKCHSPTILQVEVTCMTPRTDLRDDNRNQPAIEKREETVDGDGAEISLNPQELSSRESSFPPSVSHYSSDSLEGSLERQSFSSQSNWNGSFRRQDSVESNDCVSYCSYSTYGSIKSAHSVHGSFTMEGQHVNQRQGSGESLQQHGIKEAGDARVKELEEEARMQEQNAQKLAVELEASRKVLSDQNLTMANLNTELATSRVECQNLTQEIERLKALLEESIDKQDASPDSEIEQAAQGSIRKELEDEIKFLKDQNEDMSLQLRKTQESNVELISILQEMEESIEEQKHQIDIYDAAKKNCMQEDLNEAITIDQVSADELKSFHECDSGSNFSGVSVTDIDEPIRQEDNCHVELEMLKMQDLQQTYEDKISVLEGMLDDRIIEAEIEQGLRNHILKECLLECRCRLDDEEQRIMNIEAALSKALADGDLKAGKEIEALQAKVWQLEADCDELTEENLQLLYELKESKNHASKQTSVDDSHDALIPELRGQLAKQLTELQEENIYLSQRVSGLEAQLRYLVDAKESTCLELQHSESQVEALQDHVGRLEEEIKSQKLEMEQKLSEMQERWWEAQDECVNLGKLNVRLQTTTEALIEENSLLQKFTGELREQKLKLQDWCFLLEAKARKFQYRGCSCADYVGEVEGNHSSSNSEPEPGLERLVAALESRLKDSELESHKLAEENCVLQMQLQKLPELQNELLVLRVTLKEVKSGAQLLKASLKSISDECEELKRERIFLLQKMSSMREAASEAEDRRRKNNVLEDKLLRLEGDLIARDALGLQATEMKIELNQIQILNSQLLVKVKCLEDVRECLLKRLQSLEHGAEQTNFDVTPGKVEKDDCVPGKQRIPYICPLWHKHFMIQDSKGQIGQVQDFDKRDGRSTGSQVPEMNTRSNMKLHNSGLVEASDIHDMHKLQIDSAPEIVPKRSEYRENIDPKKADRKTLLLQTELQEIRDRYLQMSLKYAEVEAQKEHLVMKLKALSS